MGDDALFAVLPKPLSGETVRSFGEWVGSNHYELLIQTLLTRARKIAVDAMRYSTRAALIKPEDQEYTALVQHRDRLWAQVAHIMYAVELLREIQRNPNPDPTGTELW